LLVIGPTPYSAAVELDRMRAVLSHGLSPRKPGSVADSQVLHLSTPWGALHQRVKICTPNDSWRPNSAYRPPTRRVRWWRSAAF
jgi:hypothetical protein